MRAAGTVGDLVVMVRRGVGRPRIADRGQIVRRVQHRKTAMDALSAPGRAAPLAPVVPAATRAGGISGDPIAAVTAGSATNGANQLRRCRRLMSHLCPMKRALTRFRDR